MVNIYFQQQYLNFACEYYHISEVIQKADIPSAEPWLKLSLGI